MKLAPYPIYKESGVPWLEGIPVHWEAIKLKWVSQVQSGVTLGKRYGKGPLTEYPYLRVANVQNGFLHLKGIKRIALPEKEAESSRLAPGDLVVTEGGDIDKLGRGAIWHGEIENCLHQNHVFAIRPSKDRISSGFLARIMESHHGRSYFRLTAKKTTNLATTNRRTLGSLPLFLPPLEEQAQIVRFLDWGTSQINRFIRNKRQLMELLREQRQKVVNEAMTGGLDPKVKVKPSDMGWIGDIPEHWETRKLRHIATMKTGENLTSDQIGEVGEYPVYGGNGLRGYFDRYNNDGSYLLVGRQGSLCGNVHRVEGKFWATEHAIVTEVRPEISSDWYYYMLTVMNLNQYSRSAAQPGLSIEKIQGLRTALPPLEEQEAIVSHIEQVTAAHHDAIVRTQREIDLMDEYRIRLVSDVVTGQVDVRDVEVPEVAQEDLLALGEDEGPHGTVEDLMDYEEDEDEAD